MPKGIQGKEFISSAGLLMYMVTTRILKIISAKIRIHVCYWYRRYCGKQLQLLRLNESLVINDQRVSCQVEGYLSSCTICIAQTSQSKNYDISNYDFFIKSSHRFLFTVFIRYETTNFNAFAKSVQYCLRNLIIKIVQGYTGLRSNV